MPITPTSSISKNYQALGIDEIANDIETVFTSVNALETTVNALEPTYKVYAALLTQSGTDAPVATVLENTLGGTVVWTYDGVGSYNATLAGAFTLNKTAVFTGQNYGSQYENTYAYLPSIDFVRLETVNILVPEYLNGALDKTFIEIRVYA